MQMPGPQPAANAVPPTFPDTPARPDTVPSVQAVCSGFRRHVISHFLSHATRLQMLGVHHVSMCHSQLPSLWESEMLNKKSRACLPLNQLLNINHTQASYSIFFFVFFFLLHIDSLIVHRTLTLPNQFPRHPDLSPHESSRSVSFTCSGRLRAFRTQKVQSLYSAYHY